LKPSKPERAKSFAAEGTVYWLVVSIIMLAYLTAAVAIAAGLLYFAFTLTLAVVEAILAYACWTMKKWGFLASTLSA
jgi:small-conductance mechanosensitive channel